MYVFWCCIRCYRFQTFVFQATITSCTIVLFHTISLRRASFQLVPRGIRTRGPGGRGCDSYRPARYQWAKENLRATRRYWQESGQSRRAFENNETHGSVNFLIRQLLSQKFWRLLAIFGTTLTKMGNIRNARCSHCRFDKDDAKYTCSFANDGPLNAHK